MSVISVILFLDCNFQVWHSTYDCGCFDFTGFNSRDYTCNDLDVQYTMATEVNQNCFAWPHEESPVKDSSQVVSLMVNLILDKYFT